MTDSEEVIPSQAIATPLRLTPRMATLWALAWAEWRTHPWRHGAALMAVALGVALGLSVQLINDSALAEFAQAARSAGGQADLSLVAPGISLDENLLDRLSLHPAVRALTARVEADTLLIRPAGAAPAPTASGLAAATDRPQPLRVVGVDALSLPAVLPEWMPRPHPGAGRWAFLDPGQAFVNAALARELAGAPRITLVAGGQLLTLEIAGTVAAPGPPIVVIDLALAQARFGQPGRVTRIDLRLHPGASADSLRTDMAAWPEAAQVQLLAPQDGDARAANLSRAYRVNLTVLALVALLVGVFLVFSVVSLSVAQRGPQLALLGVLGLSAPQRQALIALECGVIGVVASLLGVALGTAMAAAALQLLAGDLGGGFFGAQAPQLRFSVLSALAFFALGVLAAVAGGAWPARRAARLVPAQALKGLGDASAESPSLWPGGLLCAVGAALALLPPLGGVPVAAYASVAVWLVGGIALVPWVVGALLGPRSRWAGRLAARPLLRLALERARFFRATATAAVAGVVASLALSVALTVMVTSFRLAVTQWLEVVLPADLYVRATAGGALGDQVFLSPQWEPVVAALPGVAQVQGGRARALLLAPDQPEIWLLARSLGADPARRLPLVGPVWGLQTGETGVWVSEALRDSLGWSPGSEISLPVEGRLLKLRVRGVWRDYARQFGSLVMDLGDYRQLTGDQRLNDLALWLAPGTAELPLREAMRALAPGLGLDPSLLGFGSVGEIKAQSLRIFDRSFAVTRYLQVVALVIGLAGVAASLSAQVLARRREFGLLVHLGLTRRQVLALVSLESLCWLTAGAVAGVVLGLLISGVLVGVVNPQSFHWTMEWQVPWAQVLALALGAVAAGTLTAALIARRVVSGDSIRAIREDW